MELFLNLVWGAIAIGALLTYLRTHVKVRNPFYLGLGALLCALIFLLPAISITDDLHSDTFAVEDASLGTRLVQGAAKADLSSHISSLPISFRARFATWLPWITRTHRVTFFDFFPSLLLSGSLLDRAPPCSLC